MKFFQIRPNAPWGDMGTILAHGMLLVPPAGSTLVHLARAGPFIPPITMPGGGTLIATNEVRRDIDTGMIGPAEVRSICKSSIIEYRWEHWDRSADDPPEPLLGIEERLAKGTHSEFAAEALGELWELVLPVGARAAFVPRVEFARIGWRSRRRGVQIDEQSWTGSHVFHVDCGDGPRQGFGPIIATDVGRQWLQQWGSEWFRFEDCL